LEQVVCQLGGNVERFRELWLRARDPETPAPTAKTFPVPQPVALIGRQRQLEIVHRWAADLADGQGRVGWIEGEPGIGKSALTGAAAADAAACGAQVFVATCDELSQAFPLLPLLDVLDSDTTTTSRHRPTIAETLRAGTGPHSQTDLVGAATERLIAMVDELCAASPVMLVLDDLQWADPATVLTLGRLARSARRLPLLLVGVTRAVPRREDVGALRRTAKPEDLLVLPGLSEIEVTEFVRRTIQAAPGDRLLRLAADAAGNPLYLTELMDALARGKALVPDAGGVDVTDASAPESLAAAIADRLGFLSAQVRGVLQTAALLGARFSVSELAVVSGRWVGDLLVVLGEAVATGVLLDDGLELAFRHPLIRAALYDGVPLAVRAAWHQDAAHALATDGAPADRVARQLKPALDAHGGAAPADGWIASWMADAGQQLVSQAPQTAISMLRWAMAGVPAGAERRDLLASQLADALYRVGDRAGAADVAAAALAHAVRPDLRIDLCWTLTQCRAFEGRHEEWLVVLEDELAAPAMTAGHRARLLTLVARVHSSLGRLDAALEVAEQALAIATAAGDTRAAGWALGVQTIVFGTRGDAAGALPLFERALAVTEGDPSLADLRLLLQINKAGALGDLDRFDQAVVAAERVRQLAEEAGNIVRLQQAQCVLAELFFEMGRWDDALAETDNEDGVSGDAAVEGLKQGVVATIRLHCGIGGDTYGVDGERGARPAGEPVIGPLSLAMSLAKEQAGQPEGALAVLTAGLSNRAEEIVEPGDLLADAVRLALGLGETDLVGPLIERAEGLVRALDAPHCQAILLHCCGLRDRDPAALLRAADYYAVAGRLLPQAQALEAAGKAFTDRGESVAARVHLASAVSVYQRLGARWDMDRIEATTEC
jgi:tetratricopeptide (TPR) repeat protein